LNFTAHAEKIKDINADPNGRSPVSTALADAPLIVSSAVVRAPVCPQNLRSDESGRLMTDLNNLLKQISAYREEAESNRAQVGTISDHFQHTLHTSSHAEEKLGEWAFDSVTEACLTRACFHSKQLLLGSAPEYTEEGVPALALCLALLERLSLCSLGLVLTREQFCSAARCQKDQFIAINAWRPAWRGKMRADIELTSRRFPGQPIDIVTITGRENSWQIDELGTIIIPSFPNLMLKMIEFPGWQAFVAFVLAQR